MSVFYSMGVRFINAQHDAGRRVHTPAIPVISVGNLSVGGVGKTPVVQHLARLLQRHGHRPAIVLRGYKARRGEPSDEQAEHIAAAPGVQVVANPDRVEAVKELAASDDRPSCVILDDGFQHRRLGRTLDLVLINAQRSPWRDRLLPAGWLREPVSSLRRADEVIITHADRVTTDELDELIGRIHNERGADPISCVAHQWSGVNVRIGAGGNAAHESTDWLTGRRVVVMCAIGEPTQFLSMVERAGAEIAGKLILSDHARFDSRRVEQLVNMLDSASDGAVLCTGKDWAKLSRSLPAGFTGSIAYPVVSIEAVRGGAALERRVLAAAGRMIVSQGAGRASVTQGSQERK